MEYDDAETLEIAVEQARGLESELDIPEEKPTYTVVKETDTTLEEEEVFPQLLINGWERELETKVKSKHEPEMGPREAAHEMHGFQVALERLGLLTRDEMDASPYRFGIPGKHPITEELEELLGYVCDEVCRHRSAEMSQEELDEVCARCYLGTLDRPRRCTHRDDGFRAVHLLAGRELAELSPHDFEETEVVTGCTVQTLKCRKCGYESFAWFKHEAGEPTTETPIDFRHLRKDFSRSWRTERLYSLGAVMAEDCPDNDCKVYVNIFNMARGLDEAIDRLDDPDEYAGTVLRRALMERVRELAEMYDTNHAVRQYMEGMKP